MDKNLNSIGEAEENEYDDWEEKDLFGSEPNLLEKTNTFMNNIVESFCLVSSDGQNDLLSFKFSAILNLPNKVAKHLKKSTSDEITIIEKKIQKVPFFLVEI